MVQWVEIHIGKSGFRGGGPFDFHPSDESHKKFCSEILIPLIEDNK